MSNNLSSGPRFFNYEKCPSFKKINKGDRFVVILKLLKYMIVSLHKGEWYEPDGTHLFMTLEHIKAFDTIMFVIKSSISLDDLKKYGLDETMSKPTGLKKGCLYEKTLDLFLKIQVDIMDEIWAFVDILESTKDKINADNNSDFQRAKEKFVSLLLSEEKYPRYESPKHN